MKVTLDLGELNVIKKFIHSGDIVFDVGAYVGQWTDEVFKQCQSDRLQIHSFEPHPQTYQKLFSNLAPALTTGNIFPNNLAMSNSEGIKTFYDYQNTPFLNTLYRRDSENEELYQLGTPQQFSTLLTTVDAYCQRWQIKRINFLKIDVEGSELDVLTGATKMLQSGKIDYLQFEYGQAIQDAGTSLQVIFEFLKQFRYSLFKILPDRLDYKPQFLPEYEDWQWCNYLAVNERFLSGVLGKFPQMFDLGKLCQRHSIQPKGIIDIGAYEGEKVQTYQDIGMAKVLLVEANPQVFDRLQKKVAEMSEVKVANYAICDRDGTVDLHTPSNEQSSSILFLAQDRDESIVTEIPSIAVEAKTLDNLLSKLELSPEDFNLLNIDIQGAELLALQGASNTLQFIEGINIKAQP